MSTEGEKPALDYSRKVGGDPAAIGRRGALLTIFLIVFVDLIGFGILLPNQQYYGQMFGLSDFWLVMIGPSYSIFQFLFAPILGSWSDRAGRRRVLIISQVGTFAGFMILFWSHFFTGPSAAIGITLLFASRVIDGISGGNISIASACIADITTPENRAKGMGLIGAAFGLGFICGPAIGAFVGGWFGIEWVPIAAGAFSLLALVLTIFTLPETLNLEHAPERTDRSVGAIAHALTRPVIGGLILMGFVNGFAFAGMEQTLSLLIQKRLNLVDPKLAAKNSGYLFAGIGVIIVIVQGGLIRRLVKQFGEVVLTILGPLLIAAGLTVIGLTPGTPWTGFIVGCGLLALGASLFNPCIQSLISRHAGKHEQGEVMGAHQGMASLARAVGPLLAGFLFGYVSPESPYYASAAICLVVAIWAVFARKKLRPPVS